jgi:hypothetical protein
MACQPSVRPWSDPDEPGAGDWASGASNSQLEYHLRGTWLLLAIVYADQAMSHLVNTQWKLPGPASAYLIVWWHDAAAQDTGRRVSPLSVISQLDTWAVSRRLALQEIDGALGGPSFQRPALPWSEGRARLLKERIASAFKEGWLVALSTALGDDNDSLPETADAFTSTPPLDLPADEQEGLLPGEVDEGGNFDSQQAVAQHADGGLLYGPRYDLTNFKLSPLPAGTSAESVQKLLEQKITAGDITDVEIKGAAPDSEAYLFLKYILAAISSQKRWNTFLKMKATIGWNPPAEGLVQITMDSNGSAKIELLSDKIPSMVPQLTQSEAIKELTSVYQLKVVDGDKTWSIAELSDVVAALALMPAEDRAALKGVDLVRVKELKGKVAGTFSTGGGVDAGATTVKARPALTLDDDTFNSSSTFLGDASNPHPASFETILHEVGHAVEKLAFRQVNEQLLASIIKQNSSHHTVKSKKKLYKEKYGKASTDYLLQLWKEIENETKKNTQYATDTKALRAKVKTTQIPATVKSGLEQSTIASKKKYLSERAAAATKTSSLDAQALEQSAPYRNAVDAVEQEINDYSKKSKGDAAQDLEELEKPLLSAISAREAAREALQKTDGTHLVLMAFEPVISAQETWADAARKQAHSQFRSLRLHNFMTLVVDKEIAPFTSYAQENWPYEPEEFYAEAYSLWLNDPTFVSTYYKDLYDFFQRGDYRK